MAQLDGVAPEQSWATAPATAPPSSLATSPRRQLKGQPRRAQSIVLQYAAFLQQIGNMCFLRLAWAGETKFNIASTPQKRKSVWRTEKRPDSGQSYGNGRSPLLVLDVQKHVVGHPLMYFQQYRRGKFTSTPWLGLRLAFAIYAGTAG
ncbi:unnamed protein product [Tuber aestivum]|uniref:Uncharacterized protein n=1 Tax=Tuber aestivum TaxID=59557 RepID=A0A292PK54_9PEZI|nr:unnamed protein product [Tuber aestivum]